MKGILIGLALAVMLAFGAIFASTSPPSVAALAQSASSVSRQSLRVMTAGAVIRTDAVYEEKASWVKTGVGMSPLDPRPEYCPVSQQEGFAKVSLKPKITSAKSQSIYKGLGHDHFARADV